VTGSETTNIEDIVATCKWRRYVIIKRRVKAPSERGGRGNRKIGDDDLCVYPAHNKYSENIRD